MARQFLVDSGIAGKYGRIHTGKLRRFSGFHGLSKLKLWRHVLFNIRDSFGIALGTTQALYIMGRHRPKLVFSKGGYPALPVCLAARILRIPTVTHDSDAMSSLTHRSVASTAQLRLYGVKPARKLTAQERFVGVPVNMKLFQKLTSTENSAIYKKYKIQARRFVLVTGGGLGSRNLNNAIIELASELPSQLQFVVITGKKYYQSTLKKLQSLGPEQAHKIILLEFTADMPDLLRAADFVVSRAGATALAEIAAAGKASVIIPASFLPGAHQNQNAQSFSEADAAIIVDDDGDTVDLAELSHAIHLLSSNGQKKQRLAQNARNRASTDAVSSTVQALLEVLKNENRT